ncbi:MAG TPA: hypothetical protein VMF30_03360 [Pirellulales bacterium]|nr:hypothetical protein [Pirellulales bacterium]
MSLACDSMLISTEGFRPSRLPSALLPCARQTDGPTLRVPALEPFTVRAGDEEGEDDDDGNDADIVVPPAEPLETTSDFEEDDFDDDFDDDFEEEFDDDEFDSEVTPEDLETDDGDESFEDSDDD